LGVGRSMNRLSLINNSYYEPQGGQLLAASFMDYAMPRADTLPALSTALSEVPTPTNRLGVRSGGEGGTTPALGAVINAIVDALSELGVRHIEKWSSPENIGRSFTRSHARRAIPMK
jgi:carbon-monoxide dehydrogenase large subunit